MTYSVAEREFIFRNLAGNPTAKRIAERALHRAVLITFQEGSL
ncbi:hypothetical protein ES703_48699 [subsurface metagenome]